MLEPQRPWKGRGAVPDMRLRRAGATSHNPPAPAAGQVPPSPLGDLLLRLPEKPRSHQPPGDNGNGPHQLPRPQSRRQSVPLIPAPTPAFSGGIALMMACAIAGLAIAHPAPISSSPSAIATGVPSRVAHLADRLLKLRATTVSASGAVRRPASNGP
jgi:hypothetical protein